MITPANGVAEPTEHEGNAETSVTSGISISLMDTGSASLPIKNKGTERLPALESLLHVAGRTLISLLPLFYLRAISDQLWGNAQRRVVCTQKAELGWQTPHWAEIPSECNYRMCWCCVKIGFAVEMTVWVQSCKAGRRIQRDPQRCCVHSLCVLFVFHCSISVQWQLLVESSQDKNRVSGKSIQGHK